MAESKSAALPLGDAPMPADTCGRPDHKARQGKPRNSAKLQPAQGCSTLLTEGHRKYGFETAESGGVAVLRDGVGLIEPENIVGEASNSREDARIFSNARCIFA